MTPTQNSELRTQNSVVIALDIGTSSTRAIAFDTAGHKVGRGVQYAYTQTTTPDGGVEVDADELLELSARCMDGVLNQFEAPPLAVSASCFWHSLMAVGADDRPLTGVLSWADNRSAPWIPPLRATLDEDAAHARTGCVFHTSYWPAKLLWLHHTRPELFAGGTRWMSFGEYLALRLFGEARCSLSMASGTGIFHQVDCTWDETTLAALPIDRSALPALCDADEPLGDLRLPWTERWPSLRRVPWFPALGDGACSNIGSGCVDDSRVALNVGTSGALRTVLREYHEAAPHGLWRYRIDRKRSLMGGALSNAGNVYAWVRGTFTLPADSEVRIAAMTPDAHGLTVLPFLAGERSPLWNPEARLVIEGATLDTSAVDILRACLEGASLRFAEVARAVRAAITQTRRAQQYKAVGDLNAVPIDELSAEATVPSVEMVASGGALERSACWTQIMSDCIGAPLVESREAEASARGAALMALEACGIINDIAEAPAERGGVVHPSPERHTIYQRALDRQNALYEQLFGTSIA